MTNTSHGHHIEGTQPEISLSKARCGGPRLCRLCGAEAAQYEQQKEIKVDTTNYVRKPFSVDAIRVTRENMEEVAANCDGIVDRHDDGRFFIKVPVKKALDDRQRRAYVGDWVLSYQGGWKVYNNRAFRASFERPNVVAESPKEPLKRLVNVFQISSQVTDQDLQDLQHTVNARDAISGKRS